MEKPTMARDPDNYNQSPPLGGGRKRGSVMEQADLFGNETILQTHDPLNGDTFLERELEDLAETLLTSDTYRLCIFDNETLGTTNDSSYTLARDTEWNIVRL